MVFRRKAALCAASIREEIKQDNLRDLAFITMHRVNMGTINSVPYLRVRSSNLKGWMVILAIIVIMLYVFGPVFVGMLK